MEKISSSVPGSEQGQCERELALVLEIDRIRDEYASQPQSMLEQITAVAAKTLQADIGLLAVTKDDTELSLVAQIDPANILPSIPADALLDLAREAMTLLDAERRSPNDLLESCGICDLLLSPLSVGRERLGSLIFATLNRSFSDHDVRLLSIASSQSDSAVLQARTWRALETRIQEIEARNRQLDTIYRIDRIRDETTDTNRFLVQVVDVLTETLNVDLCMVGLLDGENGRVVMRVVNDRAQVLRKLSPEDLEGVLQSAHSLDAPQLLEVHSALAERGFQHMIGAPLLVGDAYLGAMVLANQRVPFSPDDLSLIQAVASQTDSAVDHLNTFQHVRERTRQLEAIYRIDQIRDEAKEEADILSAVANAVTSALDADLCLMSLINEETGQSQLRAIEDRLGIFGRLDRDAIAQTIDWFSKQDSVATLNDQSPLAPWRLNYLMGAPLVVAGELLGSLVLASGRRGFGRYDCDLMSAVVSQTDSAIVHARDQRYLYQRNRELETLYRVDQIRDQGYEFGAMLSAVLSELCSAIEAEMGFIMLFDNDANQLELKASTADDILSSAGHYDVIESAANKALRSGKLYAADNLSDWLHSIICVPLILRKQIIGVFGAVNRLGPGGFTREDKRLLLAITSQVDTAIFESLDKQRIRNTFQRYVGPNVMEQMLDTPEKDWLKGERSNLTVLFSDMRGFTRMSELVDVDVLVEMINEHLGAMTQVVLSYDGTLDKFVADEVMAIFGAPVSKQDHAIRAIRTALDMQAAQKELIRQWRARGQNLPPIGVGINTGEMIVGNIGCDQQMDYTVLGAVVNLASRLCDAALGNQILITQETYWHVADDVVAEKLPAIRVKGKEEPVQIYQVTHLK